MRVRFGSALILAATLLIGMMVVVSPANADNLYASIRGAVTDPSGAVLPGAKLTATNEATGILYTATSSDSGSFSFLQLPIGDYDVVAEKSGFKKFTASHIHLDLDQVFALKAVLEVGALSETVTVEANTAQVETTSMQLGDTISGKQIVDLPLNGRDWTQLMQLEPGVQSSSDRFGNGAFSTNGSETQQNSFLINGTISNDITLNVPLVVPSPDAIGEFNLVTSTLNPEYGRNSGSVVNAAIKSGSNQFHGDAFEFYRDTFLDAIPWFEQQRALFHQNQFGGTIGGPIVKDHAFFFFSYEGRRAVTPQPGAFPNSISGSAPVVFSPAERGGNFATSNFNGSLVTDPNTGLVTKVINPNVSPTALQGDSQSGCGTNCGPGTFYGQNFNAATCVGQLPTSTGCAPVSNGLFSTGVIPTADLNPLALKVVNQFVPLPNAPGNAFEFNPLETAKTDQYIYRVDEKISNNDSVWFYGLNESDNFADDLTFIGANLPGFGSNSPSKTYEDTVAWNHTLSSTMLNEARFSYVRFNFDSSVPQQTQDPAAFGFTGLTSNQAPQFRQFPTINVAGLFALGFSNDAPQPRVQNTYQFTDNLSKVLGRHTLKFGFVMDREQINNPFFSDLNGTYAFNGAGIFSTSNPGADFLLGIPDSFQQGSGSIIRARGQEYYSYAQDQWQIRSNLTLTYGVGWDIDTPFTNQFAGGESQTSFIPGEQSKIFPSAPLGIVFPGDPGVGKYGLSSVHYANLAPRVGFAWSPGDSRKWSIRGGVGLYYDRTEEEPILQSLGDPPFSLTTQGVSANIQGTSPSFANPYVSVNPAAVLPPGAKNAIPFANAGVSPFPFSPPAKGSSPDFAPFEPLGFNITESTKGLNSPRVTNFNLNIERQIDKNTVATISYVGAIGRHEEGSYNINPAGQPNPVNGSFNPVAQAAGCTNANLATCAPQTFQFSPVVYGQIGVFATAFSSNYSSLQASINRRLSKDLQFQVSYTYSRSFDYTSSFENSGFNAPGFNPFDFGKNYGPSANDAPQRLVLNYTYQLPFYKLAGHRFRLLTDGWRLSGIGTFQHGFPVNVFEVSGTDLTTASGTNFYASPSFVNQTGPLQTGQDPRKAGNLYLNPNAFGVPANGVIGNANRNPFYGPGLNYWDTALYKDLKFTETKSVELRLETFDTFNHANFAAPFNLVGPGFPFGQVLSTQSISTNGAGRVVQLGAKIYF